MILITGAGMVHEEVDLDGNVKRRDISEEPLALHLDDIAVIDEGTTVLDFMLALAHHSDEINQDFQSVLRGCMFDGFLEETLIDLSIGSHFKFCEIKHSAKILDGVWVESSDIYAVGKPVDEGTESEGLAMFTLEFAPVSAYKNMPLVLNNEFVIVNGDGEVIASAFREFSLYEVIAVLIGEMSMYGYAPQRMDAFKKFSKGMDVVAESLLGPAESKTEKDLLEELDAAIKSEDYERASELRDKIEEQKKNRK